MATADLVLEGGGVKGVGLVGAISVLEEHGYEFQRIAGTSAGAIVGAMVAAGIPIADLQQIMWKVDYNKLPRTPPRSAASVPSARASRSFPRRYLQGPVPARLAHRAAGVGGQAHVRRPAARRSRRLRRSAAHLPPGGHDVRSLAGSSRAPAVGLPVPARATAGRREDRRRGADVDVDPAVLPAVA